MIAPEMLERQRMLDLIALLADAAATGRNEGELPPPSLPVRPQLAAYPNPARTTAYLLWPASAADAWLIVRDAAGREAGRQRLAGNGIAELDVSALPAGLYKLVIPGTDLHTTLSVLP